MNYATRHMDSRVGNVAVDRSASARTVGRLGGLLLLFSFPYHEKGYAEDNETGQYG